ncbi:MAG TPA: class I adenylate-forming enzyme family protein [Steroidobacter sp.]|uniref:class I adenylate-forming enzyme family protein n=1 Tax=Steroidobacter sp. TaxID=1978227 RepID=UPI002ED83999
MSINAASSQDFGVIADLIRVHARRSPTHPALILDEVVLSYQELDELMDRVAASLQRAGLGSGHAAGICASTSLEYVAALLGALRAGCLVAPLAVSAAPESLAAMIRDCGARALFLDEAASALLQEQELPEGITRVALEGMVPGAASFEAWIGPPGARPRPVEITAQTPFNVIYSSGTTGSPKGIVQSHGMRWQQVRSMDQLGFDPTAVVMCATPLYSNTTLVNLFPALGWGGTAVLMRKFDAVRFLELAQRWRATHTMLVPVQYQRIMALPQFDRYDLSSFRLKFCTSAPFRAESKRDVLARWPGGLIEYYGMTEGGGTCMLLAHEFPHKLHTVGQPAPGHEIRIIDEDGRELPQGEIGEVVGRSPAMMSGYLHQPEQTREIEWYDREGRRFIRTGDIGRFDEDGFLSLLDRRKDVIISGGFNVYPSDLESVLLKHDGVREAAVVGVASAQWGETPVAFVVVDADRAQGGESIRSWANARLGKTQRLTAVEIVASLPRNAIGKVLKRQLRESYGSSTLASS